jgi:hypothetical protein
VGVDRASGGVHDPDGSNAGSKIFLTFSLHLGGCVAIINSRATYNRPGGFWFQMPEEQSMSAIGCDGKWPPPR